MQKNKSLIITAICLLALVITIFLFKKSSEQKQAAQQLEQVEPNMRNFSRMAEEAAKGTGQNLNEKEKAQLAFDIYLATNEQAARAFEYGRKIFGDGPHAEAAAQFLSLTMLMEDSAEYNSQFKSYMNAINQKPAVVLTALDRKHDLIVKEPFIHQMTINLINLLNIPRATKIKYLARELLAPVKFIEGAPTPHGANIFMAMDFLRDYRATAQELRETLLKAKSTYAANSREYFEFRMKAVTFFPGVETYL